MIRIHAERSASRPLHLLAVDQVGGVGEPGRVAGVVVMMMREGDEFDITPREIECGELRLQGSRHFRGNTVSEVDDLALREIVAGARIPDVADVLMLATQAGPVRLYPALTVLPDATIAEFDVRHPEGADYVIVPAMSRDDDPAALAWLQSQAEKEAIIIGICADAKVVGAAGLLDGKRATTHWYYLAELLDRTPSIDYVANRRMVVDNGVATTTGITASMPMMLTLIEAIAGREKAEGVARELGLSHWDARHASGAFQFTRPFAMTILTNVVSFWNRDEFGLVLQPGVDEVSLALVADAWSRSYRSKAVTFADAGESVETANGIRVIPDEHAAIWPKEQQLATYPDRTPADALEQSLLAMSARYGARTANIVAMQLEYPRRKSGD